MVGWVHYTLSLLMTLCYFSFAASYSRSHLLTFFLLYFFSSGRAALEHPTSYSNGQHLNTNFHGIDFHNQIYVMEESGSGTIMFTIRTKFVIEIFYYSGARAKPGRCPKRHTASSCVTRLRGSRDHWIISIVGYSSQRDIFSIGLSKHSVESIA